MVEKPVKEPTKLELLDHILSKVCTEVFQSCKTLQEITNKLTGENTAFDVEQPENVPPKLGLLDKIGLNISLINQHVTGINKITEILSKLI